MIQFILLSLLPILGEGITQFSGYFIGVVIQCITHLGIPIIYNTFSFKALYSQVDWKETITWSVIGSIAAITCIAGAFFGLLPFIDIELIKAGVASIYDITIPIYILVGLTISFINPFLEEVFWRGFIFGEVYKKYKKGIWIGALFALHHVLMLSTWFSWWQVSIIGIFLAIVGILFNWLYIKTKGLLCPFIIHTVADITIVTIGFFILF